MTEIWDQLISHCDAQIETFLKQPSDTPPADLLPFGQEICLACRSLSIELDGERIEHGIVDPKIVSEVEQRYRRGIDALRQYVFRNRKFQDYMDSIGDKLDDLLDGQLSDERNRRAFLEMSASTT